MLLVGVVLCGSLCWYSAHVLSFIHYPKLMAMFSRPSMMSVHTISGCVVAFLGIPLLSYIASVRGSGVTVQPGVTSSSIYLWCFFFLLNTGSGFLLVPRISHADPSTKREFISLVLLQLSFLGTVWGGVHTNNTYVIHCIAGLLCSIGMLTSFVNVVLYGMDWMQGRSGDLCTSSLERTGQSHAGWVENYITIIFTRGSQCTRMPANKRMLLVAASIFLPFPMLLYLNMLLPGLSRCAILQDSIWFTMLLVGSIGNIQIFHGSLSVAGKCTIGSSTHLVLLTTFIEIVSITLLFYSSYQTILEYCVG
jgi:hypothetical protein